MSSRQRFLIALTALTPLAVGRSGARAQSTLTPLVVNLTAVQPDVVPFLYSVREKQFQRAGLDISYSAVPTGVVAMAAVLGGAANIGFGNPLTIVTAFAKGAPLEFVAPGSDASASAQRLFVLADAPIRTAKDLEGRTVAVTGLHDLTSIGVRAWAEAGRADASKIQFIEIPPSAMIAAVQAKRVDACAVAEPFRSEGLDLGLRVLGEPFQAIGKKFLVGAWFAHRAWTDQHRDAALRFAEVMRLASQYVDGHFDELIPFISSYSRMSEDVLKRIYRPHFPDAVTPDSIQPLIDVVAKYKEIPAPFRAQDIILSRS